MRRPFAGAQRRVVVKAHVVRLRAGGARAAALHLRYIQRDGVERDGSLGVLYGADGPVNPETFEEPRLGERHQFRFIVSPEDGGELDLKQYVRDLMKQVETDTSRKLEWAAVNHFDTDRPHAHLVVRGIDREGRQVRFDREYISHGLRFRAQELATRELGPRLEHEIQRARAREVHQERFTSLDRDLERSSPEGRVDVRVLHRGRTDASLLVGRLEHLEGLGVAERERPGSWVLKTGWQENLRELGTRGDIIAQMHQALSGDPSRYRVFEPEAERAPSEQPAQVTGRVAAKGLADELRGTFFAIVEVPNGDAYRVPLAARDAQELRVGDVVSVGTRPQSFVRPADREIAAAAESRGGLYSLELAPPQERERHEQRLRKLQTVGLAVPAAAGRWSIAPNMLEVIEKRGREHFPEGTVVVHQEPLALDAQVRHPGPVWLDRVKEQELAPYGFGAQVQCAAEARHGVLRQNGIEPTDPHRESKLAEVERRTVGREMAARLKQTFEADAPAGFRGRAQPCGTEFPHSRYAVVSDGRRFAVVRSSSAGLSPGKALELERDGRGGLAVRKKRDIDMGR